MVLIPCRLTLFILMDFPKQNDTINRGRSRISGKGVHMYKDVCVVGGGGWLY